MSENLKKLLELVSRNEDLAKKLSSMDKEETIALAKELGIELTEADFEQKNELSDDELDTVAGGKSCFCAWGGGTGNSSIAKTCACVAYGQGDSRNSSIARCVCYVGGGGDNIYICYGPGDE